MAKSVQNVKNSLKFKAVPKQNILSVKIGTKKFTVPVEARMLTSKEGDFLYLSFQSSSEIYRIVDGKLDALADDSQADTAEKALTPPKGRRRGKTPVDAELPAAVLNALKSIPPGYKLVAGVSGGYRMVRTRIRKKKGE